MKKIVCNNRKLQGGMHTQKWQWDIVRKSQCLLPFLLCVFLLSCKTFKSVSCDFNYFPTKNEMVLDTINYPLDNKITIKNKTYHTFKLYPDDSIYYLAIDLDTLGIVLTKFITYNNGNIKEVNNYFNSSKIGMEYHFDENGNVIKEVNNDEDFGICWQQALFIAKKYVGRRGKEWDISKRSSYKGRRCWNIYYFKGRGRLLLIDAQTGEILGKGFSGISTNDLIEGSLEDVIDTSLYEKDSLQ